MKIFEVCASIVSAPVNKTTFYTIILFTNETSFVLKSSGFVSKAFSIDSSVEYDDFEIVHPQPIMKLCVYKRN